MTKSPKRRGPVVIVDEDGYETDGMYRWGGKPIPYSPELLEESFDRFNECYNKSAPDRIADLRKRVTALLQPHVAGPYSPDAVELETRTGTLIHLNLSTGSGAYIIDKGVSERSYLDDAIRAVMALDELTFLLTKEPLKIDRIVRTSIEIGSTISKAEIRALYAPAVLSTMKRLPGTVKGGKSRAKWNARAGELATPMLKELRRSRLSDNAMYQRVSAKLLADHGIELSARTIMRHIPPGSLDKA